MARTPYCCGVRGLSSTFILTTFSFPAYSRARSSTTGPMARQGPHQGAQKSINTGVSLCSTSRSKESSETDNTSAMAATLAEPVRRGKNVAGRRRAVLGAGQAGRRGGPVPVRPPSRRLVARGHGRVPRLLGRRHDLRLAVASAAVAGPGGVCGAGARLRHRDSPGALRRRPPRGAGRRRAGRVGDRGRAPCDGRAVVLAGNERCGLPRRADRLVARVLEPGRSHTIVCPPLTFSASPVT